jgi:hypothetical protein
MKLCKDCKHYRVTAYSSAFNSVLTDKRCHALDDQPDIEDGGPIKGLDLYRTRAALCGWDFPRYWQAKEAK